MTIERVVLDTNVLISAVLQPAGKPAAVLQVAIASCDLIFSAETWEEITTRLMRPKFDRLVSQAARADFLADLHTEIEWVVISGASQGCRDPDDDKLIETAVVGRADCLVTGDGDLLTLRPIGQAGVAASLDQATYQGVAILRPAEFLDLRADAGS